MCGIVILVGGERIKLPGRFYEAMNIVQTRGQGSAGIACSDGNTVETYKNLGLVPAVFNPKVMGKIEEFSPVMAMGHTRYPTAGNGKDQEGNKKKKNSKRNAQPQWLDDRRGRYALCANGDVPNLDELKRKWKKETGMVLLSDNDSEFILKVIDYYIDTEKPDWKVEFVHGITRMMENIKATYAGALITGTRMYIYRDPYENRPYYYGRCEDGMFVAASETAVLDTLGATLLGEVKGGEIMIIKPDGSFESVQAVPKRQRQFCIFEYIYFSRPDSKTQKGFPCSTFRRILGVLGARSEKEKGIDYQIDCVLGVPDSGNFFAEAYAMAKKIAFRIGVVRNSYVGRTFIDDNESVRESRKKKAEKKYTVLVDIPQGITTAGGEELIPPMTNVAFGDDSIVRFLTTLVIMAKARVAGYGNVHFRISSPPIVAPCHFGIDMKTLEELIAANYTVDEMVEQLGAASLIYLPMEKLEEAIVAIGEKPEECCMKCLGVPCAMED